MGRTLAYAPSTCPLCDDDGYVEKWLDMDGMEYPVALPCPEGCASGPSVPAIKSSSVR